jgi:hypothetical protein
MGDIGTHAGITEYVVAQLQKFVKSIPQADYTYLELGNFLTDVCQFRDPPAFHKAREPARRQAQDQAGTFSGPVGVDAWVNGMFGVAAPGPRHGWLPEFLRLLAYGLTHQVFDPDGLTLLGAGLDALGQQRSPLMPKHPIDSAEVDRVMEERFTQYFPHEHVDFPPIPEGAEPRHREESMFKRDRSGLIKYLEDDIKYVSEELSKLEKEWFEAKVKGLTEQQRRDFLARLGHLLHAVEDYFFHSNFEEIRQLQFVRRRLRRLDLTTPGGKATLIKSLLAGTGLDDASVHLRRLMFRRLRYPVYTSRGLSAEASEDGSEILITGGFGQAEVWHTLGGALEAIEDSIERHKNRLGPRDPRNSKLILVRMLFSADARRDLARGSDDDLAKARDEHATQLTDGRYPPAIESLRKEHLLSERAAVRLTEAFALDRQREEEYKYLPGPGGVLLSMLRLMQIERDESARQTRMLDATAQSIAIERSANDASAENVGTHSLLSKDSPDKDPFRAEAVALASYASAGVATALLRRIESNAPITQGVNWDAVLHFYLRFPKHPSWNWEEELVAILRRDRSRFKQPDVGALKDQAKFPLLGPNNDPQRLFQRRTGVQREALEAFYRHLERPAPS